MTLYLLFDALRDGKLTMHTELRVSAYAAAQSPTKLDLSEGDKISVANAIGAIVTKSANDMAVVVAEALAGSEEEFARRMTQKARTIGMLNTTFKNASGLPNAEQRTTAQDLIILGKNILADHPERSRVFSTRYFQYNGEVFRNHNSLLFSYPGMEGMKTGFTTASGFNLLATARRGDKRLLAVVLGGHSAGARNASMRNILDSSWSKAMTQVAARKAGITLASSKPKPEEPKHQPSQPAKVEVAAAQPARSPAAKAFPVSPISQARIKPDQVSAAILFSSLEAGLARTPTQPMGSDSASDMRTDEPEERANKARASRPNYTAPSPQEIASNETLVRQALSAQVNVSVHNKTVRGREETPLDAVAIDPVPEGQPPQPIQPVKHEPPAAVAQKEPPPAVAQKEEPAEPQTLAAATVAVSQKIDQPGPFHIQVGAFSDQAQAEERIASVKQALGSGMLKAHPEFIMQIALPSGVTMYRARLSRFADEAAAKSACRKLKRSGIECWDIKAQ
jgi:D-alanyl-D-alanine carboxypeptidase